MKKFTVSLCALIALGSAVFAGTETYSRSSKSVAPETCPQWYADNEFNVSLWGTYAFTGTEWRNDTYLGVDHAWGGGLDAKYFIHRYFGFGVQGNLLSVNTGDTVNGFRTDEERHAVGELLGTFTLRFPISCSRFAPYVWAGGGGIFGGGRNREIFINPAPGIGAPTIVRDFEDRRSELVGQVGGGFEVRLTPHIGLLNDFSWNIVSGSQNNFGMARTGINFAF